MGWLKKPRRQGNLGLKMDTSRKGSRPRRLRGKVLRRRLRGVKKSTRGLTLDRGLIKPIV